MEQLNTQNAYAVLKEICTQACHERHACTDGYRQMLASGSVESMMAVWRANWDDVVQSKYADIICRELPRIYPSLKAEMNRSGIYLNECPEHAAEFVRVLVTATEKTVEISGYAKAYILGPSRIVAKGHAQVYNYQVSPAVVFLHENAYGHICSGEVWASGRSRLTSSARAILSGSCVCHSVGGSVRVRSCLKLTASGDTVVESTSAERIELLGNATLNIIEKDGKR